MATTSRRSPAPIKTPLAAVYLKFETAEDKQLLSVLEADAKRNGRDRTKQVRFVLKQWQATQAGN